MSLLLIIAALVNYKHTYYTCYNDFLVTVIRPKYFV